MLIDANFTLVSREGYRIGVPIAGWWTEVINSDAAMFAGSNYGKSGGAFTEEEASHGRALLLVLNLLSLAVLMLRPRGGRWFEHSDRYTERVFE